MNSLKSHRVGPSTKEDEETEFGNELHIHGRVKFVGREDKRGECVSECEGLHFITMNK